MKHLKILGLSLFALVAVMAVTASGAQANYILNGGTTNGDGSLTLKLKTVVALGEMLIQPLNAKIHCEKGEGTVTVNVPAAMTTLSGSGTVTFSPCKVLEFPDCTVKSLGAANNTIVASGAGAGTMPAKPSTEVLAELSSSNFTEVVFLGELCAFDGLCAKGNGSAKLAMADAAEVKATHNATLDDVALKYGSEKAELHSSNPANPISATVTKESGGNWAIQLTGL